MGVETAVPSGRGITLQLYIRELNKQDEAALRLWLCLDSHRPNLMATSDIGFTHLFQTSQTMLIDTW
jgi:hypothetical protein